MSALRRLPLALALLTVTGCREFDIIGDTAGLDRHFVPLLVAARSGDSTTARLRLKTFLPEWERYRNRYRSYIATDSLWTPDFEQLDTLVSEAAFIIDSEDYLPDAHEDLEDVRMILFELRERNDIDYFVDYLNEFSELAEQVGAVTRNRSPDSLTEQEVAGLAALAASARGVWDDVQETEFDAASFGFDVSRQARLEDGVLGVAALLTRFEQALAGRNQADIINAGTALRPESDELYLLFGDFETE